MMSNNDSRKKFQKLVNQIALEKKHALEKFNSVYGKLIYFAAYSVCTSKDIADEVLNDVLVKIWIMSPSIEYMENPEGWLYTIAVNEARNKRKKIKRECTLVIDDIIDEHDRMENILAEDSFLSLISDLSSEEQDIFIYRFVRDLKFAEIAKLLGKSVGFISAKFYRALNKVKKKLEKFY